MSKINPISEPPISQSMIDKAEAALHEVLSGFNYILPADGIRRILEAAHAASGSDRDPTTTSKPVGTALADALAERRRQVEGEGWIHQHDDQYRNGELTRAATCYLLGNPGNWPWSRNWWKPTDRRRDLIKAAALIIAEIERLDRAAIVASEDSE